MPNRKILLSLFCVTILLFKGMGQSGTMGVVSSPHSPEASSLGKFVEMPVGYYNGLQQVSVPLYNLKTRVGDIPVSLDYHPSGVKVKDIPGWVGAGWNINAGGVINRIVKGAPDDELYYDDSVVANIRKRAARVFYTSIASEYNQFEFEYLFHTAPVVSSGEAGFYPSPADTEYDQYSFNFMGYSGRFTFSHTGRIILLPQSELKIEYIAKRFKITDDKGIVYFFNEIETAKNSNHPGNPLFITSWFLSEISIPYKHEKVEFRYKRILNDSLYRFGYFNSLSRVNSRVRLDDYSYTDALGAGDGWQAHCSLLSIFDDKNLASSGAYTIFLDTIISRRDTIRFFSSLTRNDVCRIKLDSIHVKHDLKTGSKYFSHSIIPIPAL